MEKFRTGNIVRLANGSDESNGSIVIINRYRTIELSFSDNYRVVDWISFNSSNCSGCTRVDTVKENEMCWECSTNDGREDSECENCKGTGNYIATKKGMDKAVVLADNAKAYILKNLTKNFDF